MQLWEFVQKWYENEDSFIFYNNLWKINMNIVKKICLGNNLLTHISENAD